MNLGSYYIVGIPSAIVFAFVFHIGGKVFSSSCLVIMLYLHFDVENMIFLKYSSFVNRVSGWG